MAGHKKFTPYQGTAPCRRNKEHYPCPGWLGDPLPRIGKFERWHLRPQKAWRLYWATHPSLFEKMNMRSVKRRKLSEKLATIKADLSVGTK